MTKPSGDNRPPLVVGMEWFSQITSIAFLMVLPAAAGYWIDEKLGTRPWLLIGGAAFGLYAAMTQLFRTVGKATGKKKPGTGNNDNGSNGKA